MSGKHHDEPWCDMIYIHKFALYVVMITIITSLRIVSVGQRQILGICDAIHIHKFDLCLTLKYAYTGFYYIRSVN